MKRINIIVFSLLISLFICSSFPIAAQYDPEVYQAQKALDDRGYKIGPADGFWGKATERTVKYFQVDNDLPVTGKLDERTKEKLGISSIVRSMGIDQSIHERRIALVIGNGAYKSAPLKNPVNDAQDMATALRDLGFEVIHKENADRRTMGDTIFTFSNSLKKGGVGLFYYAGHGVQVNGRNYLIPIGASIRAEREIKYEAVDAGLILDGMFDAGNGLNIVLLDACRDNPFARSFRTSSRGLARMDAPTGTFIAYATAPGSIAADGIGRNGIFTEHFLKNMGEPGLKIEEVMMNVRNAVIKETNEKQVPWQASSLTGNFYFVPKIDNQFLSGAKQEKKNSIPEVTESYRERLKQETIFWESIKDSNNIAFIKAYLEKYPFGTFAHLAKLKISELTQEKIDIEKKTKAEEKALKKPSRGWIGVAIQDLSGELAEYYGLKDRKGVLVTEVFPGDPADQAGIKPQDIILEIDGKPVETTRDLTGLVAGLKVGGTNNIVVFRDGKKKRFRMHIAKRDDDKIASRRTPKISEDELGIRVENITPEMKRQFNISEAVGVIVSGVKPGGKGTHAGVKVGDIIKEVNHTSIKTVIDYRDSVNQVEAGGAVQMFIKRVNAGFIVIKITFN